ncbi:vasotab-TY2-like [Arctopsyche grandis]|uniref:vasotab-TY2-like n=1 Tax=Arctopsyche grandis TaxID=121162 RepID=UPI00406D6CAC
MRVTVTILFLAFFVSAYVMAEDDDCPKVCPFLYSPVCGVDTKGVQRKFANECELKITNCRDKETTFKKIKDGDC